MIALEERDRNRDGIRDTQLRFYYTNLRVCVYVTSTFYKNKNFVQIGVHVKMHIKL
jgi:hypothetical protein